MPRLTHRISALVACSALVLTGCATAAPQPPAAPEPTQRSSLDNCGTVIDLAEGPPERVVTIKSTSTEMLLALGLGDRIVGTAFQDGPVPEKWAADAAGIPVLADKVPSQEVVLEAEPDFVYAGWESNFSADGAGTRPDLAALGIRSYVSPAASHNPFQQHSPLLLRRALIPPRILLRNRAHCGH